MTSIMVGVRVGVGRECGAPWVGGGGGGSEGGSEAYVQQPYLSPWRCVYVFISRPSENLLNCIKNLSSSMSLIIYPKSNKSRPENINLHKLFHLIKYRVGYQKESPNICQYPREKWKFRNQILHALFVCLYAYLL